MSSSINAVGVGGTYTLPFKPVGLTKSANSAETAHPAAKTQAAVAAAQQALAKANSTVDQDKRTHSPDCAACDQKLVDKAQGELTQAKASASDLASQTSLSLGSKVDFTA
ncbi:hypothetical protein [Methylobacterium sp. WL120]|uniref:hypothetical protein n=1 Tax=Methylobacterium sp. WL120 TaxID=2603887 RepID=UPI0011CC815D|nr:hypothetical protein [Methylobacterium sp. WL120]TXM64657.1 hypothetical protein FV229_17890 [Methylobacterium sp. WL120]